MGGGAAAGFCLCCPDRRRLCLLPPHGRPRRQGQRGSRGSRRGRRIEAPTQTALITSKVDELAAAARAGAACPGRCILSRRGSDAGTGVFAAPPPAPAAVPPTTVRGKKKRGPVKGASAKADSKIRMVDIAPMAAWYHDPRGPRRAGTKSRTIPRKPAPLVEVE